jgi:mono/diheme cytochrome c family protein
MRAARALPLLVLAACAPGEKPGSEYMPDMAYSRSYKAFAPNPATPSGITLQRPVPGTIARGHTPFAYGAAAAEAERAGAELRSPFRPTAEVLEKGKALYGIYCAVCHGAGGKGDGPLFGKIPPPPDYRSARLLAYPVGRLYHVMTRGAGKMPAYATLLSPDERWLVATYVRAELQGLPEASPAPALESPPSPPQPGAPR